MKRLITLSLVVVMVLFLFAGCSSSGEEAQTVAREDKVVDTELKITKSSFELAQGAYESLKAAYELVDQFGADLNNAWYVGVNEKEKANGRFAEHLATKVTYLSKEELLAGIARAIAWEDDGKKWASLSEEEKASYIEFAGSEFYINSDYFQYFCISSLMNAYYINGRIERIEKLLVESKDQLKELNEKYPESPYYTCLKGFYTTTDAYFTLCYSDGDGGAGMSFNQFKELRGDYIKEVQGYLSDLAFEFEE